MKCFINHLFLDNNTEEQYHKNHFKSDFFPPPFERQKLWQPIKIYTLRTAVSLE